MNKILLNDITDLINTTDYGNTFDEKTILVTGANGLIAKYLTLYLLMYNKLKNTNIKVLALVRNKNKLTDFEDFLEDDHLEFLYQDVCDPINYPKDVDYIFHAASNASAYAIRTDPIGIIKANVLGTINVLEFAKEKNIQKIVFPSTREIYGKVEGLTTIKETDMGTLDPLDSRNCYPESKRMAEAIFKSYSIQYGIPFNILRIAHTYGPTMPLASDGRVMADFLNFAVNNEDIVLNSDGTAVRAFCYITDTIKGILTVFKNGSINEVYNLSNTTEPLMIRDLALEIVNLSGKNINLKFKDPSLEELKGYTSYKMVDMDNSKLEQLGWQPEVELKDGLARTLKYYDKEK